jgi:Rrf2 family protein
MKNLSRQARYALRALYALTGNEHAGPMLISTLAEREHIPRKFLEATLLRLKNAGVLKSRKGRGGGYALSVPADQITLAQVVRAIDGAIDPLPCLGEGAVPCDGCVDEKTCGTRHVMMEVRNAIAAILDTTTVASVCLEMATVRLEAAKAPYAI